MNPTRPSGHEIEGAISLLSVLEMAKDATQLKAALAELRAEQQEADDRRRALQDDLVALAARESEVRARSDAAEALQARAEARLAEAEQAYQGAADDRAAARSSREQFDSWAARERERIEAREARCAAQEADVARRERELADAWIAVGAEKDRVGAAQDAAIALKAEYEAKIAALKQVVS